MPVWTQFYGSTSESRFNLVRHQGIFSPASRWRSSIVPFSSGESELAGRNCCNAEKQERDPERKNLGKRSCSHPRNYPWAELMKRVFEIDVLKCECGERMRILCAINPPEVTVKILDCLGLKLHDLTCNPCTDTLSLQSAAATLITDLEKTKGIRAGPARHSKPPTQKPFTSAQLTNQLSSRIRTSA